jgi:hypothetical protein
METQGRSLAVLVQLYASWTRIRIYKDVETHFLHRRLQSLRKHLQLQPCFNGNCASLEQKRGSALKTTSFAATKTTCLCLSSFYIMFFFEFPSLAQLIQVNPMYK